MTRFLSSAILLLHLAAPAFARVWHVNTDSALAAAVNESAEGDTIELVASSAPYLTPVSLRKDQTIVGSGSPVIAAGAQPAIVVTAPNVTIDGVAIDVAADGDGVVVRDVSGTFRFRNGAIRGSGRGAAVRITGGEGEATFEHVAIARTNGAAVAIRGRRSGAISFRGGSTIEVNGGKVDAIAIEDTAGSVTFADAITIATIGARGLYAKSVGTLSITAGASLTSTDAAAIEIRSAALDVAVARVSATRSTNGYLDTGVIVERVTGKLVIAGGEIRGTKMRGIEIRHAANVSIHDLALVANAETNGTASGNCAPIEGAELRCNAAIVLEHVDGFALRDVRIEKSGQMGVTGSDVRNATFDRVSVSAAGNELNEHAMQFRELGGDVRFAECTVKGPASRGLDIVNAMGEARITVEKSAFSESAPPNGQQAMYVSAEKGAKVWLRVIDSTFTRVGTFAVHVVAGGDSNVDVAMSGNKFDRTGGITLIGEQNGRLSFDVRSNSLSGGTISPVNVMLIGTATANGTISDNTITGASCNSCGGISVEAQLQSKLRAAITNNRLSQIDGYAIRAAASWSAVANVAVTGNVIREPLSATTSAIRIQAGGKPSDTADLCAGINANQISGAWDPRGAIQLVNRTTSSRLRLAGYTGKGNDVAAIGAFVRGRNAVAANVMLAATPHDDAITACEEMK